MKYMFLLVIFRLTCVVLFLYQAGRCMQSFVNQEPATKDVQGRQEDFPRPQFCVSVNHFDFSNEYNDQDWEKYKDGQWKMDQSSEEEFFIKVTPKLSDLVKYIEVENFSNPFGDAYQTTSFKIEDHVACANYEEIDVIRKDYYFVLRTYCIDFK